MSDYIEGYNNRYIALDNGNIYDSKYDRLVCQWIDNVGYKNCILFNSGERHYYRVHRLIAQTLVPNPQGLPQVNHIDGNKTNNSVSNLEWVDNSQNTQHGYDIGAYQFYTRSHKINVYDKNGTFIAQFKSIRQAAIVLNLNRKTITAILKKEKENNYPYLFEYAAESVETIERTDKKKYLVE